jgi:aspartyl-tRNA(Asn)/glutamyl-tRNA(Gln) amidotransferase subunit A
VELDVGEQALITAVMRFNALAPLTGLPALSIPCGFADDGMPIGLQAIARPFAEGTLFRLGHGYEQITDWHTREPALSPVR